ncbi:unnamed protein product [Adineta steineri]|uniref:Cilia- and flagella-associated protein 97 n=1 Tax=Adineta steineri TaxID=433720 RepID=A0A816FAW1_9BILA|nr:unnamed protein product [Adineta steineri]CAF1545535.1 unnamed protein product [Adineta steineri]CAF1659175.1 unnamed protein product [Adineta steineri]
MHKSYQSTLPSSNRLLKKKWDDKYYSEHRLLVRDARPTIDTRPPRTYMHLHMKLKKLQLQEERTAIVERDNRILLEKMAHTMKTTGCIDNRNNYEARSLNQEKRRRELLRVAEENGTLAKRIVDRKPILAREGWQRDSQQNNAYLNNIAKYELGWHAPKSAGPRQASAESTTKKEPENPPPEEKKESETSGKPTSAKGSKDKTKK